MDVGDDKALVAGFPECEDHFAIAGKLNDSVLMGNGSLLLPESGILLAAGTFCLENVLESAGKIVVVVVVVVHKIKCM